MKVSVLIPTFRSAQYVGRAIESACSQTARDIEVIVCDNASDDDTWDVIEAKAAGEPRMRIFRNQSNMGPVRNWLRCAREARSEYVCLLFSDDWYEPDFVAESLKHMTPYVGFVVSAVNVHGSQASFSLFNSRPGLIPTQAYIRRMTTELKKPFPLSPCCALFRRVDLLDALEQGVPSTFDCGFNEHGGGPDVWIYLLAASRYSVFAHTGKQLVNFSNRADALSARPLVPLAYTVTFFEFSQTLGRGKVDEGKALAAAIILVAGSALKLPLARRVLHALLAAAPFPLGDILFVLSKHKRFLGVGRSSPKYCLPLSIPQFEQEASKRQINAYFYSPARTADQYKLFKDCVLHSIGRYNLPIYRMADGEFIFAVGDRPAHGALGSPGFVSVLAYVRRCWRRRGREFKTVWGESYSTTERTRLRQRYEAQVKWISQHGMLAMHFTKTPGRFSEEYRLPVLRWLNLIGVDMEEVNYTCFYFMYALLCGADLRDLIRGRRVLVVTGADAAKMRKIRDALLAEGALDVQSLSISPTGAMVETIDVTKIALEAEIALIGAGVGSANILNQLTAIKGPCLDSGIALECFANPTLRGQRPFTRQDVML